MNLKNMLNERSQTQEIIYCMIPCILNVHKRHIYRNRKYISSCLGVGVGNSCKWACGILQRDGNILKQIYSDVAPFGKITKNHRLVYMKWVNFTICKIYLNKIFFLKSRTSELQGNLPKLYLYR